MLVTSVQHINKDACLHSNTFKYRSLWKSLKHKRQSHTLTERLDIELLQRIASNMKVIHCQSKCQSNDFAIVGRNEVGPNRMLENGAGLRGRIGRNDA